MYPECVIYDHFFKICGQSDEVRVINNHINIFDIKTDKAINDRAYQAEWGDPEKLLPPVEHLDSCNKNIYSLKMSMYMYMLWKQNKHLKIGDIILEWTPIERDVEGIPIFYKGKPKVIKRKPIKVPYLRKEVKAIFEAYKKKEL